MPKYPKVIQKPEEERQPVPPTRPAIRGPVLPVKLANEDAFKRAHLLVLDEYDDVFRALADA